MKTLFWSVAVQNLFNVLYFDYAVASSATLADTMPIRCRAEHS